MPGTERPQRDIHEEHDDRFYIEKSSIPGAGYGLFARVPLAEGDRLEVIGALVPADSASDVCTRFADLHKFRVGALLLIPLGFGGLVNHSRSPNMAKVIEGHSVYLRATRAVLPNEELTLRYGDRFFEVARLEADSW